MCRHNSTLDTDKLMPTCTHIHTGKRGLSAMARRACNRPRRVSRSGSCCSAKLIKAREVLPRAQNKAVHKATRASSDLHEVERRTCMMEAVRVVDETEGEVQMLFA